MVGAILGTPLYMSPEQAIGQVSVIDHRTDIYSAGVVSTRCCVAARRSSARGTRKFCVDCWKASIHRHAALRPEIPAALEAAIARALDRDIEKRFPNAAAMREAISFGTEDATQAPMPMSASIGDSLVISLSPLEGQDDQKPVSIGLLDESPVTRPAEGKSRRALPGADPVRAAAGSRNVLPARRQSRSAVGGALASEPNVQRVCGRPTRRRSNWPRRRGSPSRRGTREPWRRNHSSLGARDRAAGQGRHSARASRRRAGYVQHLAPGRRRRPARAARRQRQIFLSVEPGDASLQIDHVPAAKGELSFESGTSHVLNAAAPGRVTRRFSFEAKPGAKLSVRLGHSLPLPSPTNPEPLPAELAAGYPDDPRPADEINRAFAKLDRFAECLALIGDANGEARKGNRVRLRGDELAQCQRVAREAAATEPAMSELQAAAETYFAAIQTGRKNRGRQQNGCDVSRGISHEARTAWQMEEVAGGNWRGANGALAYAQAWPGKLGVGARRRPPGRATASVAPSSMNTTRRFSTMSSATHRKSRASPERAVHAGRTRHRLARRRSGGGCGRRSGIRRARCLSAASGRV